MKITYDANKNAKNIQERGLSFDLVDHLDWETALFRSDMRKDYGERRYRVFAMLDKRLYVVVVTPRDNTLRIISFRKANKKGIHYNYDEEI